MIGLVPNPQTLLALVIFLAVMALAISRPRGLNEAWPAVGGAAALLALGLLSPADLVRAARETVGILLFLFGMMLLSTVLEMAGVFAWAASYAARQWGEQPTTPRQCLCSGRGGHRAPLARG